MTEWKPFALAGLAATPTLLTGVLLVLGEVTWAQRETAVAGAVIVVPLLIRAVTAALRHDAAEDPDRTVAPERIDLEEALRRALGDGQLNVAYQPVVDLATGVPVGAEALARWVHPERGPIPPATFIPIAEEAGLIGAVGDRVRQEALRMLGTWRADGTVDDAFHLSINVSGHQLTDPHLPSTVSAELLRYGVPARCVAFEISEPVPVDAAGRVLFELRELGCHVLIDDFGTGYSPLGHLRRFPVTGIKIDRSFVAGLGSSREDDEIVRAVVAMSRALGHTVIAEGVETRLQRDALAAVGVTRGQGWLWGPAVPPAEFARHWHATGPAVALAGRNRRD
ncbi:hypothetical protein Aab01nite_46620 [Paractinoplanes abujensis]|uniref:EAL domain-containing protein (Putative c-di-GMP-specific phosphodiesterase class I) n=1 Tax=Paractinoplanes abujensis TaxID=882441 RepID=A0A7W7FZ67_9ACTN|nr:EAL domain-containing protein [Actinoplanes abujensis]MBB4690309.1 EAL domain-containing protein (putative c-di-GMP-specific phosphodiesterase class I) [Actinoplanes abujensis]GID21072.1 hypothetical protein Aab01nite_46620 [Actinoplanes abujensis]